jgi:hypothetical protein
MTAGINFFSVSVSTLEHRWQGRRVYRANASRSAERSAPSGMVVVVAAQAGAARRDLSVFGDVHPLSKSGPTTLATHGLE